MALKLPLHGVITALVTPFSVEGNVDQESLRELVDFQLKHKVDGFFVCGSTGLGPAMSADQRKKVAEIVVIEAGRRVPVIVQVGAADPATSLELAAHAEKVWCRRSRQPDAILLQARRRRHSGILRQVS